VCQSARQEPRGLPGHFAVSGVHESTVYSPDMTGKDPIAETQPVLKSTTPVAPRLLTEPAVVYWNSSRPKAHSPTWRARLAMGHVASQHRAAFVRVRNLQFETVSAVRSAATFALSRLLRGGCGEALVRGFAGASLGGMPAPGLCAVVAALVVAVQ
jgi:hypothetical protein